MTVMDIAALEAMMAAEFPQATLTYAIPPRT